MRKLCINFREIRDTVCKRTEMQVVWLLAEKKCAIHYFENTVLCHWYFLTWPFVMPLPSVKTAVSVTLVETSKLVYVKSLPSASFSSTSNCSLKLFRNSWMCSSDSKRIFFTEGLTRSCGQRKQKKS